MMFKKNIIQKVAIIVILVATFALLITSLVYVNIHWIDLEYTADTSSMIQNFFRGGAHLGWTSVVFSNSYEAYQFYFSLWDDINAANDMIFDTAITGFGLVLLMYITGNFSRKKYYVSNLITGIALPIVTIIMSIITIVKCSIVLEDFNIAAPDLQYYTDVQGLSYLISGSWGIFAIVASAIYICLMLCFMVIMILKFKATYPYFKNKKEKNDLEKNVKETKNKKVSLTKNKKISAKEVVSNE